jgi:hypothetical protein
MCSVHVVIADVFAHQPFEMPFIQCDHVIQQGSSTVTNPAFGDSVLPGTAETGSPRRDAEALYDAYDIVVEVCATVKDEITGYRVVGKGLAKLLSTQALVGASSH